MTARQIYEQLLIELDKVQAPTLLLNDFNYFINKGIIQYVNKKYNMYEMNQQLTDDLRVLKRNVNVNLINRNDQLIFEIPDDYLHLLNCICTFEIANKCGGSSIYKTSAVRLTSDISAQISNNYYNKPSYKRPFWQIKYDPNLDESILDIQCGTDDINLTVVNIDYLKTPEQIDLTPEQIDTILDFSQTLEFQDYVCYEIINELVKLVLENISSPRLQTHIPVNQTVGLPIQHQSK